MLIKAKLQKNLECCLSYLITSAYSIASIKSWMLPVLVLFDSRNITSAYMILFLSLGNQIFNMLLVLFDSRDITSVYMILFISLRNQILKIHDPLHQLRSMHSNLENYWSYLLFDSLYARSVSINSTNCHWNLLQH